MLIGSWNACYQCASLLEFDEQIESYQFSIGHSFVYRNIEVRHEIIRLIAEFHNKNQRVAKEFADRIERLKSALEPRDRVIAARWLSRSMALADVTVPALLEAVKRDPSAHVKRAAMLSLAGFHGPPDSAIGVIDKGLEYFKGEYDVQFIVLASMASSDSESRQLVKTVRSYLLSYKTPRKSASQAQMSAACNVLQNLQSRGSWAVSQLLDAAESAMVRTAMDLKCLRKRC